MSFFIYKPNLEATIFDSKHEPVTLLGGIGALPEEVAWLTSWTPSTRSLALATPARFLASSRMAAGKQSRIGHTNHHTSHHSKLDPACGSSCQVWYLRRISLTVGLPFFPPLGAFSIESKSCSRRKPLSDYRPIPSPMGCR